MKESSLCEDCPQNFGGDEAECLQIYIHGYCTLKNELGAADDSDSMPIELQVEGQLRSRPLNPAYKPKSKVVEVDERYL